MEIPPTTNENLAIIDNTNGAILSTSELNQSLHPMDTEITGKNCLLIIIIIFYNNYKQTYSVVCTILYYLLGFIENKLLLFMIKMTPNI